MSLSMTLSSNFSSTRKVPLRVSKPGLPIDAFSTRRTSPSRLTVMVCRRVSTTLVIAAPTVNVLVRLPLPQTPSGSGRSSRSATTRTMLGPGPPELRPRGSAARCCSSTARHPRPPASSRTSSRSTSASRAASGSSTGRSSRTTTGWPIADDPVVARGQAGGQQRRSPSCCAPARAASGRSPARSRTWAAHAVRRRGTVRAARAPGAACGQGPAHRLAVRAGGRHGGQHAVARRPPAAAAASGSRSFCAAPIRRSRGAGTSAETGTAVATVAGLGAGCRRSGRPPTARRRRPAQRVARSAPTTRRAAAGRGRPGAGWPARSRHLLVRAGPGALILTDAVRPVTHRAGARPSRRRLGAREVAPDLASPAAAPAGGSVTRPSTRRPGARAGGGQTGATAANEEQHERVGSSHRGRHRLRQDRGRRARGRVVEGRQPAGRAGALRPAVRAARARR